MATTLDLVYKYRQLIGKCQSGRGLDLDEIDALITIEALFGVDRSRDTDLFACRRQFAREPVQLRATLRNKKLDDEVEVIDLGPGGLVCTEVPYLERGDNVEVVFNDEELGLSYRFRAVAAWIREDGDDYACGFELQGTPVLVRLGPKRARTESDSETEQAAKVEQVAA